MPNAATETSRRWVLGRSWTSTSSFGGSLQGACSEKIFGHDSNSTAIAKLDGEFAASARNYSGTGTLRYSR